MLHNLLSERTGRFIVFVALLALVSVFYLSCNEKTDTSVESNNQQRETVLGKDNPGVKEAIIVQEKHTDKLMQNMDVVATAVGLTEKGNVCILVLALKDLNSEAKQKGQSPPVPEKLDNIPVRLMVTGEFRAFKDGSSATMKTLSYTAKQNPPIDLGTSGGWRYDLANGYCCSGTLGSLVTDGSNQYILSNYHVFYADIVSGGNNIVAQNGDFVIQPGLVDVNCTASKAQNVAALIDPAVGGSLPGGNVDAGIARVIPGMVDPGGSILGIGTISKNTLTAALNQKVKKSGRTTGLTRSYIKGLNAIIRVTYDKECASRKTFTKKYTKQIIIDNPSSSFLDAGDSGSLMVEDISQNPRAVGLLYAGSSTLAVACSISDVLSFYSGKTGRTFTMVGQ